MKTGQMAKPFDFCWRGKSTISGWKHNMTSLTLVNCFYFVNFFCVSFYFVNFLFFLFFVTVFFYSSIILIINGAMGNSVDLFVRW